MAILDVDLERPLPDADVTGPDGVAVLGRVRGRPVLFTMCSLPTGVRADADVIGRILAPKGEEALREITRRSIAPPPPRAPVALTIAVCTRGRTADLARCLASVAALRQEDRARATRLETLVVDNAPPDGATRALVQATAGVRYALEPRPGLDFARNRALREARGDWIAYLDDDVELDAGWLGGLQEALAENLDAVAVTGLVLPRELETTAQVVFELRGGFRRGFRKRRFQHDALEARGPHPISAGEFGAGANMAFRREALLALGGFDEALDTGPPLPGGGDLDIFYRVLRSRGVLVYEPAMLVFHRHRTSMNALRRQYESWGRGYMAFLWKVYASEPDQRPACRWMLRWWFTNQARQTVKACRCWTPWSPVLPLAEMGGGIAGLVGRAYPRSAARSERIRREHP
jgi:glycosyltransferase involved in cell wall biosynthesis